MAALVRLRIADGVFTLPVQYGARVLNPGQSVIIADTVANVQAALGVVNNLAIEVIFVPDGQAGAITPGTAGATSAAQAASSATAAAVSQTGAAASVATAAGIVGSTGGTSGYWTGGSPTSLQDQINRIAAWIVARPTGFTGPIPRPPGQ